ncbi:MAG TPA: hypothetical protein VET23_14850 [Chitinophagaceae bacterium]|nr:hypothetical protein [Chitinophagaceae bacterium]
MKGKKFLTHFAAASIITFLSGLIYVSVQQSYRSGANDPQLRMARDISSAISNNRSSDHLFPKDTVEISESLAEFVILYNSDGNPIQSTGLLNGNMPRLPKGVFDFTRKKKEDVFTWQPRSGIRMAMVIESVQSSRVAFAAAGRSLLEVEKRENNLVKMVLIGWLACLGVVFLHFLFFKRI